MCAWGMLQVERGRLHGKADLGQSAVVYRKKRRQINVDTDDVIFHLKVIIRHHCVSTLMKHMKSIAMYTLHMALYGLLRFAAAVIISLYGSSGSHICYMDLDICGHLYVLFQ